MNIRKEFPSEYLKAIDFDSKPTNVTIKLALKEIVGKEDPTEKAVVYFTAFEKPLVLNKTNGLALGDLLGDETDTWAGKTVCLFTIKGQMPGQPVSDWVRIGPMDPNAVTPEAIKSATEMAQEAAL